MEKNADLEFLDNPWKPGLPKGGMTNANAAKYEIYLSPIGAKWHRKKIEPNACEG